jgi:hypothetical protein
MSELKNGDLVLVGDTEDADFVERIFIGMFEGDYVSKDLLGNGFTKWKYCIPLPKKTYRPFKDVFEVPVNAWFRLKNTDSISKMIGTSAGGGVFFYAQQNADNFQDLLENHEMSTDGKEWTPAGVKE